MVYCSAPNCTNDSRKTKKDGGVTYHSFPNAETDGKRRKEWVCRCRRVESWQPGPGARLCSDHFKAIDFKMNPVLCGSIGFNAKSVKSFLREDAVPTSFSFTTAKTPRDSSALRKRKHHETIAAACASVQADFKEYMPLPHHIGQNLDSSLLHRRGQDAGPSEMSETDTDTPQDTHENKRSIGSQVLPVTMTKGVQASFIPITNERGTNATTMTRESATQTDKTTADTASQTSLCDLSIPLIMSNGTDTQESQSDLPTQSDSDSDWEPSDEDFYQEAEDSFTDIQDEHIPSKLGCDFSPYEKQTPSKERKFLVFESCLRLLFTVCQICAKTCKVGFKIVGSAVLVVTTCKAGHECEWWSQPLHGSLPIGNLLLAAGILFSGSSPVRAINSMQSIGIATIRKRTYFTMQALYLVPSVFRTWESVQAAVLQERKRRKLSLSGDARCCSPGHTAKYGSYSIMDATTSKILDVSLVQSNEVKNSYWMEIEGLKRSLHFLIDERKMKVVKLVTDRHTQIKKYMRTTWPGITHWFDCWHVAKGVTKKMEAIAKKRKACCILQQWAPSVSNHIYWSAATSEGNGDLLEAKWLSILNHVVNKHDGHGNLFPCCLHGQLEEEEDREKDWIKKGSKPHKELELILTQKTLVKDIKQLSPAEQTSALESYHKIVCFFAPKSRHFFYEPMKARLLLAAMHFNENSERSQKIGTDGEAQWSLSYPKARAGAAIPKQMKVDLTYGYVQSLLEDVMKLRDELPSYRLAREAKKEANRIVPGPVCEKYERRLKSEVVAEHHSRFNCQ